MKKSLFTTLFLLIFLIPAISHASLVNTSSSAGSGSLSQGLVGWWTFDGADLKNNVADKSGQGNNGYMQDFTSTSSAITTGKMGQGLKFDGVDDYVNVPYNSSLYSNSMTVAFWAKSNTTNYTANSYPVSMWDTNSNRVWGVRVTATTDKWALTISTDGTTDSSTDTTQSMQNGWHHIVATTVNAGSSWTFYYDSVPQAVSMPVGNNYINQNSFVTLGGLSVAGNNWNGNLDDVRVYPRALSASEIKQLYNLGSAKINQSASSIDDGLVGWWTFDGGKMINNVADSSGQGNAGYMQGFGATSTAVTSGKMGQGLKFDGVDDYVSTNSDVGNISSGTFTISTWFYNTGSYSNVGSFVNGTVGSSVAFGLREGLDRLTLAKTVNSFVCTSPTTLAKNKWYHGVVTYNGATCNIYVNGSLNYSLNTAVTFVSGNIKIGQYSATYFKGGMDDIRIYNRVLSASEIKQLYNLGSAKINQSAPSIEDGLVGWWTFDGKNMISNVSDSSGLGNHGVLVNFGATSTMIRSGKIGQALNFDGINDKVRTTAQLPLSGGFTYSSWLKASPANFSGSNNVFGQDPDNTGQQDLFYSVPNNGFGYLNSKNATDNQTGWTYALDKKWHHIVIVEPYTGDVDGASFYVDGVLITAKWAGLTAGVTTSNLTIGGRSADGGIEWRGSMDDVRAYNRVLTASEVKQLYNIGR